MVEAEQQLCVLSLLRKAPKRFAAAVAAVVVVEMVGFC